MLIIPPPPHLTSSTDKTLSRLAAYIENVRRLELENGRLEQQVSSIEETNTREVTSVRNMYDKELSQVHCHSIIRLAWPVATQFCLI